MTTWSYLVRSQNRKKNIYINEIVEMMQTKCVKQLSDKGSSAMKICKAFPQNVWGFTEKSIDDNDIEPFDARSQNDINEYIAHQL